jgi:hypothetical protein
MSLCKMQRLSDYEVADDATQHLRTRRYIVEVADDATRHLRTRRTSFQPAVQVGNLLITASSPSMQLFSFPTESRQRGWSSVNEVVAGRDRATRREEIALPPQPPACLSLPLSIPSLPLVSLHTPRTYGKLVIPSPHFLASWGFVVGFARERTCWDFGSCSSLPAPVHGRTHTQSHMQA